MAAGLCAVAVAAAPTTTASAADAFAVKINDHPNRIDVGETVSYKIKARNNAADPDYLIVVSWEAATFVSFDAPPGWHVNPPPAVTPTAISTFYTPTGDTSTTEAWTGWATFTLVVEPDAAGTFDAIATIFAQPVNFSDQETTTVRAPT